MRHTRTTFWRQSDKWKISEAGFGLIILPMGAKTSVQICKFAETESLHCCSRSNRSVQLPLSLLVRGNKARVLLCSRFEFEFNLPTILKENGGSESALRRAAACCSMCCFERRLHKCQGWSEHSSTRYCHVSIQHKLLEAARLEKRPLIRLWGAVWRRSYVSSQLCP